MTVSRIPQAGDIVRVRARPWLVEAVQESATSTDSPVAHQSCLQDDALGESLSVMWDHEVDATIPPEREWASVVHKGFEAPRTFAAYLHTLRWSSVTSTDAKLLQAPYRAGIDVKAYQLEPLRRALSMPRVNLFIADDVGLGKTIEAGLVLRELLLRACEGPLRTWLERWNGHGAAGPRRAARRRAGAGGEVRHGLGAHSWGARARPALPAPAPSLRGAPSAAERGSRPAPLLTLKGSG